MSKSCIFDTKMSSRKGIYNKKSFDWHSVIVAIFGMARLHRILGEGLIPDDIVIDVKVKLARQL